MIYLQNIKFVWLILWPGGAYTDDTYATKPESRSHIMIHFINGDYIGSLGCIPNEPKRTERVKGWVQCTKEMVESFRIHKTLNFVRRNDNFIKHICSISESLTKWRKMEIKSLQTKILLYSINLFLSCWNCM